MNWSLCALIDLIVEIVELEVCSGEFSVVVNELKFVCFD